MNRPGALLRELHDAVTDLAKTCRSVAERQAADCGTYHPAHTVAAQCDRHAERVRAWGERFEVRLHAPTTAPEPLSAVRDAVRHTSAALRGDRREAGLALLHDLCHLHEKAQRVHIRWVMLGQVARALRECELLAEASALHDENRTQIKWITTRIREATPQAVTVPD
ncbi:hypothetical protein ABT168_29410 [Streptomyces sp. NPDC001793]|uniref:hypothetical protein n=1 Tax=Streptomyces sp. NPDC001793 TaxID=3154657 RepID=UPI0033269EB3